MTTRIYNYCALTQEKILFQDTQKTEYIHKHKLNGIFIITKLIKSLFILALFQSFQPVHPLLFDLKFLQISHLICDLSVVLALLEDTCLICMYTFELKLGILIQLALEILQFNRP